MSRRLATLVKPIDRSQDGVLRSVLRKAEDQSVRLRESKAGSFVFPLRLFMFHPLRRSPELS